uniref:Legume lectin domain-containing protein n=1 Tax=Ananas comosus var. bracteatus TaxID=296719 RepID=A0A6V7QU15_ANACO
MVEMRISQLSSYLSFLFVVALVFVSAVRYSEAVEEKAEAPFSFSFSFSFDRSEASPSFASQIVLSGDAAIIDSAIRVTRPVNSSYGGIACREPIRFVGTNPGFSTYFVFSISQRNGGSLAFSLTPSSASLESTDVLRSGTPLSPSLISVKFITASDPTSGNRSANYVAIDVGAKPGVESSELSGSDLVLSSGQKLHSWIDYNGITKKIEVRVSKLNDPRPADLLLSHPIDLSNALWREKMLVGISSTSGNSTIYSWSFHVKHGAPHSMHSDPLDPHSLLAQSAKPQPIHPRRPHSWGVFAAMVFAAALGALLMWYATVSRRPVGPMEYQMNPIEIGYERIVLLDDKVIREC